MGPDVGLDGLAQTAGQFGFGRSVDLEIPFLSGEFPPPESVGANAERLRRIARGNQYVTTNALHMAIVGGAIANDGTMMRPYLVREVRASSGRPFRQNQPQPIARPHFS